LAITRFFVMYSKASASAQRIRQVLETPQDLPVAEPDRQESEFHIEFEHVSFSYHADTGGQYSLEDISFSLRRGEKLGIIGPTGSGKSTIIRLLLRLYDPTAGTIRINGEDIRGIPAKDLHTKFGVVFQNDVLFADTVRANIDFGRGWTTNASKRRPRRRRRGVPQFAAGRPWAQAGHQKREFERGQKQRLLIARALAGRPEILILDDSSSALDYKTDALLRQALASDFGGTTAVIGAQRISSVMNADRILVLEDGRAAGFGTHDFLMKTCESYAEIYRSQMGGRLRA
jgi:ATP-binding cassette subfamily B protein